MSFSGDVKQELAREISEARHCTIAEISALIQMAGKIKIGKDNNASISFQIENAAVARKYFTLIKNTFEINSEVLLRKKINLKKNQTYIIIIKGEKACSKVLHGTGLIKKMDSKRIREDINPLITQSICCRRAYLRGAFLGSGSVSDPEKGYHLEFVNCSKVYVISLQKLLNSFDMDAKVVKRKNNYVAYLKEGSQVVNLLNIMGAHVALMELENIRIIKEMRNNVNRLVNCETANLNKTVLASVRQVNDIKLIQKTKGLSSLTDNLKEVAYKRLENPNASLKELGRMLTPPVGKSGVNHRLRRLNEMASELREQNGGN